MEYLNQRLARVYDSAKKLGANMGEVKYSTGKTFAQQVDDVLNGMHNKRLDLYVSQTPKLLIDLGLSDSPLLMRNGKINKILVSHPEMSENIIKQIPEKIKEPIVVLKSKTHPTESVKMITDIITEKGDMIIPIWVNQEGNYIDFDIEEEIVKNTNFVASAYGRNIKTLLEYANENDGFLYQTENIKKVRELLARNGLQLPTPLKLSDSDIIVASNEQSVNTKFMQGNENNSSEKQFFARSPEFTGRWFSRGFILHLLV